MWGYFLHHCQDLEPFCSGHCKSECGTGLMKPSHKEPLEELHRKWSFTRRQSRPFLQESERSAELISTCCPSLSKAARRLEVISFHSRCAKWHSLGESSPTKERLTWATWDTASGWELLSAVVFLSLMMEADPHSVSCYKHCLNLGSSSDPRKAALHRAAPTARAAKGVSEGVMLHVPLCFGIITDICLAASKRYRAQKIKPGSS